MNNTGRKILLIWPPFITASHLPLGIPFLAAYLKRRGRDAVQVIDLNKVYMKKLRPLYYIHTANRLYHQLGSVVARRSAARVKL